MKKAVIISSVVWLTALMGATAWAQDSLYVRQVGQLGSLSVPYCVALEGELACVGDSSYGLRVVDLSNPALPVEIGSLPVGSGAKCIALQDSIVCLSLGANGLRFIDLHNPATPVLLSNYNMTGEARDLVMTDQYVYMVGTSGLRIIDIANMNQPVEVGSFTASVNFRALSVAGNYVYISDIAMGMRIVNVSDPENPTEVGTHIGPGCHDIAIRGNYAFITYNVSVEGQIVVLDITDSTHPEYITRISVGEMATILSLVGDFAYVSGRTISIVDISHPTNPIEVGYYNPGNFLLNQACDEGLLAAVDRTNLRIFSVDVPDTHLTVISPEGEHGWTVNAQDTVRWRSWNYDGPIKIELNRTYPIGTWEVLANYTENDGEQAVWISGGISERCRVRVSAVHDTISDISNADFTIWTAETDSFNVVAVGRLDTIYHATDVRIAGNYAYVGADCLQVIDISNPAMPQRIFFSEDITSVGMLELVDNYLYCGCSGRLDILDLSDPAQPTLAGRWIDTVRGPIAIQGDYAYLAGFYGWGSPLFRIVDISNPASPYIVGEAWYQGFDFVSIAVSGNYAYIVDGYFGLNIFDVSDPANPTIEATLHDDQTGSGIQIYGNYAYIASGYRFHIIDISDPTSPVQVATYSLPYDCARFRFIGNYLYVSSWEGYVSVINVSIPIAPLLVGYYRTPLYGTGIDAANGYIYQNNFFGFGVYRFTGGLDFEPVTSISLPTNFTMQPAYPNPFNSTTMVRLDLPQEVRGRLVVYDVLGREVQTVTNGTLSNGSHTFAVDASQLSSGMYFVRWESRPFTATQRVCLIR